MKLCLICHELLRKGDKLCVLSFPVQCIGNGSYSMYEDFLEEEKVVHYSCFVHLAKDLILAINGKSKKEIVKDHIIRVSGKTYSYNTYKNYHKILKEMGDSASLEEVMIFCRDNKIKDDEHFVLTWIDKRSKVNSSV